MKSFLVLAITTALLALPSSLLVESTPVANGCGEYYVVQAGDYCNKIETQFNFSNKTLLALNPGIQCKLLQPGEVLCVKAGTMPNLPYPTKSCTVPGTFSITFDDGPNERTPRLLNYLKSKNITTTFFLNGINIGNIYTLNATVKRIHAEGHQIGHHTMNHLNLQTLTAAQIRAQITELNDAFRKILGFVPTYFRPPYGYLNLLSTQILYNEFHFKKIVTWDVSPQDSRIPGEDQTFVADETEWNAEMKYLGGPEFPDGHISLFAPWVIETVEKWGYKVVPVATCLGDTDPSGWYTK